MPFFTLAVTIIACTCTLLSLCATPANAAMDPSFELDPTMLQGSTSATGAVPSTPKRAAKVRPLRHKQPAAATVHEYTVRSGDNLFKILMRDYGLTNAEAEACIEETLRANHIGDIKRLKIGQKILIPQVPGKSGGHPKKVRQMNAGVSPEDARSVPSQALRLEAPTSSEADPEALLQVTAMWNKLLPPADEVQKPLSFNSAAFSLTLDPGRYPIFKARDGARIVVDQHDSIPPLVKSLIAEKDPTVRIVSGAPMNSRRFLSALLGAAGFYSVEENFTLEFGHDPTVKVHSDFKIEKTPESLIRQDVVLLNSTKTALPKSLSTFLKREGFTAFEPFAVEPFSAQQPVRGAVRQITAVSQPEMVDAILNALAVTAIPDRRVDVFAADNNGISLSVRAERYFEREGKRYVIAGFDGDPVTYTLFRILETKGYHVVILDKKDEFRRVAEKILASLQLSGSYSRHMMVPERGSNYTVQLSGFSLAGTGGSLFLTNLPLDRMVRELLVESGYDVQAK